MPLAEHRIQERGRDCGTAEQGEMAVERGSAVKSKAMSADANKPIL